MSTNPVEAIITTLEAAGLDLIAGTNMFSGPMKGPDKRFPKDVLFLMPADGPEPQRVMGQSNEVRFSIINLQLRQVRFAVGDEKARDIQNALQGVSINGFMDVKSLQSIPTAIGENGEGHHLWSMGFMLTFEEDKI